MEKDLKQQPSDILKIALYGPESTGKTTLANQLADAFHTIWTPEFARDYLQQKWDATQQSCTLEDLLPIAVGQTKLENEALEHANAILFCDTNLMVTKVYSEWYYQQCDPELQKAAKKHKYDLFLLTDIDVPWEKDDLRDTPEHRNATFDFFEKALIDNHKPYIKLSGNKEVRLQKAIDIVQQLQIAKELGFTSYDFVSIYQKGISLATLSKQFHFLRNGVPALRLDRPATLHDGIQSLTPEEAKYHADFFDEKKRVLQLKKFVPASGAASRMFKFLLEFIHDFDIDNESINAYINRKNDQNLALFIFAKEKFPFYNDVLAATQKTYPDYLNFNSDLKEYTFIKTLLLHSDFDYSNKPKGILPFHHYANHVATPIEEHIKEGLAYASSKGKSHLHFTVSEEHLESFQSKVNSMLNSYQASYNTEIHVSFSFQKSATDVIAVTKENVPFRDENDRIIFRPGGHGALIENLNQLHSDLVFIKNIDNVIQNHTDEIALYKKALAGILLQIQEQIFACLKLLESAQISNENIHEIEKFVTSKLNQRVSEGFAKYTKESKIEYLFSVLHRPIRVCGMVKNEGEPGGGPFWVKNEKGQLSLQIVEASQITENQWSISQKATHFNPVDLVCGLKDYQGQSFNLLEFVDETTGFIVEKNKNGKTIKAYELPGLWNGAMANWLTVFVEVPLLTFNPVKTVNDLLKATHQPTHG
jgi:nicotinamide riboside kinase